MFLKGLNEKVAIYLIKKFNVSYDNIVIENNGFEIYNYSSTLFEDREKEVSSFLKEFYIVLDYNVELDIMQLENNVGEFLSVRLK